ncbi:MAG: response regulator [Pseudomonadota bacterium]
MHRILVLDDSIEDRFFVRRAVKKVCPESTLHEFVYAEEALGFLRSPERPKFDLLLIDINMPRMTGFEFADVYLELYPELRGNASLYIVSSSINPDDMDRVDAHPMISGFLKKPIMRDVIAEALAAAPQRAYSAAQ